MQLDVTEEQLQVLDELVSERITSLATEIRRCDNRDYRHELARRRDVLRTVSTRLRDLGAPNAESL